MKKNIEDRDNKTSLLGNKKTIDRNWEDELNEWIIEELFSPYQAS